MPSIGSQCYELRIRDGDHQWRIMLFVDDDAIVILDVFRKTTRATPTTVITTCKARLWRYRES
jgi:phage-related protein